jgi:hypothetical protein
MFELVSNVTSAMAQMAPTDMIGMSVCVVGIIVFYAWFLIPLGAFR